MLWISLFNVTNLNMNNDNDNLKYHYNNYIYPNPVKNIDIEIIENKKILYADPNFSFHILWPEKQYLRKSLNILIAGCGSDQAAIIAKCNPLHKITGIDLSLESIKYQETLKKKHNIKNLNLICNDFRNVDFESKFDYIISSGVIHHLINPETALKYFYKNLEDDGVINLMVYGDKQSNALNEVKKIFNELKLEQDDKSIYIAKKIILGLNSKHPAKIFSKYLDDFNYDAGIVDLLLHNQESFYKIKNLIDILDSNGLIIKNVFDGKISSLTKFFLFDNEMMKKIRNLDTNKKLELSQILNWNDRTMELVLCKKNNLSNSIIYNPPNILDCYIYHSRSIKYKINVNSILVEELYSKNTYIYNLSEKITIDWREIFKGQKKLKEIIKDKNKNNIKYHKDLFEIFFENKHIEISLNRIHNYENYLGKI